MKRVKRLLAMVLALVLLVGMVPAPVRASGTDSLLETSETKSAAGTAAFVEDAEEISESTEIQDESGELETVTAESGETDTVEEIQVKDDVEGREESAADEVPNMQEEPAADEVPDMQEEPTTDEVLDTQEEPDADDTPEEKVEPMRTASVQDGYEQVESVLSGNDYVVVYQDEQSSKYYALTWDGENFSATEGTVSGGTFTPESAVDESAIFWTYTKGNNKGFTLKDSSNIKVAMAYNEELSSTGQMMFGVSNNNSSLIIKAFWKSYYLSYSSFQWKVSDTQPEGKFSFYRKPDKADNLLCPDDAEGDEMPQYPDQGAVRINKTATSDDFNGTGVARVELGTTGVPMKKGVDVVIVLDVSTSMTDNGSQKMNHAKRAACDFVDKVLGDNADGSKSNNRVGVVTFAGWENNSGNRRLFPLKNALAKEEIKTAINRLTPYAGTDYDYAFSEASAVLQEAVPGRDTYIVFMTDGAPSKYNNILWEKDNTVSLVKGATSNDLANAKTAKDNGAIVYSIGFDMNFSELNNGFDSAQAQSILKRIATDKNHYIPADDEEELNKAFADIATSIRKAGTNAVVTDQIGNLYDLKTTKALPNGKGDLSFVPNIEVALYDVYTKAEVGTTVDGQEITLNDVGKRKGTKTVVETVTFDSDGSGATSNLKSGNIMDKDGNITAEKFSYNAENKTFTWTVGDITEQEAVISYYVYLKGSMEGERGDGLYDTNEYAKLNYINYKGNAAEQTFTEPKMPWGAAVVNYEFYLVNNAGLPVNSRGDVIPFENRIKISDVKQAKFNWNSATNVEAQVEAKKFVPAGYTLHIEDAVYTAHAVSSGDGSHDITGTIPEGSQESTNMYQADAQYTNSYVAFGVLNRTTLIPDAVVLDYGKSVTIDVMANDLVMDAVLDSVGAENADIQDVKLGEGSTETLSEDFASVVSLTNGTATVLNGKITYVPTRYMDSIDRFLYAARVTTSSAEVGEPDVNYYRYQKVSVIPATTVYYEDDFGNTADGDKTNGIVYSGLWKSEGNGAQDEQDNGTVTADGHPYGSDSSYADNATFSAGSAHKVVGTRDVNTTACFTFKGTGFDLIGRTDTESTSIAVKVEKVEKDSLQQVSFQKVDTAYNSGTLYQIPVYECHGLDYGEYTVSIIVGQSGEANTFYLDAIRIYDPIDPANTADAAEANAHYVEDKEANAAVTELRRILLSQYTGGTLGGAIYVDGENTDSVSSYENIGPNNEIYLKGGQSIGLLIETSADPASVQIGAKAPDGTAVFKAGSDTSSERTFTLNTATDMYYDITDTLNFTVKDESGVKSAQLVVTNTGEEDTIVSLTHLKITYADAGRETSLITDETVVANTLKVASARAAGTSDHGSASNPPEAEPEEKPTGQIFEKLNKVIRKIFGRWLA